MTKTCIKEHNSSTFTVTTVQSHCVLGASALHQNACNECIIETIMYKARIIMFHVSLHLSEYGDFDLELWPFDVMHATWM